ncbi:lysoplasmalogenase [bacterium]|nr:lysoplasmalogenase [bacterium]
MKFKYVTVAIIVCGLLAIAGSYGWPDQRLYYIFKPATTILILFVALTTPASKYKIPIVIGMLFSLMGDIFLMLPSDQFLVGLICFLITHICYIVAFLFDSRFGRPLWPYVLLAAIAIVIFELLSGGIDPAMKLPVAIYAAALSFMTAQAIARNSQGRNRGTMLAAIGAVLFLISDTTLAYDRFVTGFFVAHAIILSTYYCAQYLIALSGRRSD